MLRFAHYVSRITPYVSRITPYVSRITHHVLLVCGLLIFSATPLYAQGPHRAGLVVQFSDGTVVTRCVTFAEDEISGEDVLRRSGLTVIFDYTSGLGTRVCKIEADGCDVPAEDCWCQCQGSPCLYWNYFYIADGVWRYSGLGCGSRTVRDGGIEGWVWGNGRTPPPLISLDDICGTSTAANTPIPTVPAPPSPTPLEASTTAPPSPTASEPGASPALSPTALAPGATFTPRTVSTSGQPSPTPPDSRTPFNDEATTTAPSANLGGYAAFAVIVLVLSGLGLYLRKRMS